MGKTPVGRQDGFGANNIRVRKPNRKRGQQPSPFSRWEKGWGWGPTEALLFCCLCSVARKWHSKTQNI